MLQIGYRPVEASLVAMGLLTGVGTRLAHSRTVAYRASIVAPLMDPPWRSALADAGWLHDVGYSPGLVDTGFHPLDGARYLRDQGWPREVCRLVAWHSAAAVEAELRGLYAVQADEFPAPPREVWEALAWADLTSSPTGDVVSAEDRVAEVLDRYPADSFAHRALSTARPVLFSAVARIEALLECAQPM
jgi:hypothetical protein